jgi:hypothetical protein
LTDIAYIFEIIWFSIRRKPADDPFNDDIGYGNAYSCRNNVQKYEKEY